MGQEGQKIPAQCRMITGDSSLQDPIYISVPQTWFFPAGGLPRGMRTATVSDWSEKYQKCPWSRGPHASGIGPNYTKFRFAGQEDKGNLVV